jgi:DNA ligase (NAD+)
MSSAPSDIISKAKYLLQRHNDIPETAEEAAMLLQQLRECIQFFDRKYYIDAESLISDYEYDRLFSFLKNIESQYPELITADSPTQRVANAITEEFVPVQHTVPMLSLENSYNAQELIDFHRKVTELVGTENIDYCVEPKFDGSSIALVYENNLLVRAATRGDGITGEDITNNARVIRSIPLSAVFSRHGITKIELRGEIMISIDFFKKMNAERARQGLPLFQNARNTVAGTLRLKDASEVAKRNLEAFVYQIAYAADSNGKELLGNSLNSHYKNIQLLHELGFKTPTVEKKLGDIHSVIRFCEEWEQKRDTYPYEIDGMVIKVDNIQYQRLAGATTHHPRWAIAFKFKAKQATTRLRSVEFWVGRTGAITPVAQLEPVSLSGVTISSVSLHNEDFIKEKDLRLGDLVIVARAGEVIPYITGIVANARNGTEREIHFPKHCPSCGSKLVKPENESVWRCVNADCPAQIEEKLIHFVSKDAMDIEGMGREIVTEFVRMGFIRHIPDIYKLDYSKILQLEGWREKSVNNLRGSIEKSKHRPLWRLLYGLGIRHVGATTAKYLAKQVRHLKEFRNWSPELLMQLEDIGPKVAASIYDFFNNPHNIHIIDELEAIGVNVKNDDVTIPASDKLAGKTFLFTGVLSKMTREKAKELVEQHGGKLLSAVSKNLDYLVAGKDAGSKLEKARKIPSIQIINEEEFLQMIQ